MHHEHPELIKDQYWDEVLPSELPYTVASEPFREEHPEASTAKIEVPAAGTGLSYNSTLKLDEMGMGEHAVSVEFRDLCSLMTLFDFCVGGQGCHKSENQEVIELPWPRSKTVPSSGFGSVLFVLLKAKKTREKS